MYQINENEYNLHYSIKRLETIEARLSAPVMTLLYRNSGMVSIQDLRILFVSGLRDEDTGTYIPRKMGEEAFNMLLEENGYSNLMGAALEALDRDCPFLFQEDSTN